MTFTKERDLNDVANAFFGGSIRDKLAANAKAPVINTRDGEHLNCDDACCADADVVEVEAVAKPKTNAEYKKEIKAFCDRVKREQGKKQIKWNTELVRELFAIRGWFIPEDWEFTGKIKDKVPYYCPKGDHFCTQNVTEFCSGKGCGACRRGYATVGEMGNRAREKFRATEKHIPFVWVYQGSKTPIPYWCEEGKHWHEKTWDMMQGGRSGCSKCLEVDPEEVRERFKSTGKQIPLVWVYQNASTPIPYWCEEGQHWHEKTWDMMQGGRSGCSKCMSVDPEEVRERFKSTGKQIPLTWVYQNASTPIPYWCEEGQHWHEVTWGSVQSGNEGCGKCLEVDPEEVREMFKSTGKQIPLVWVYQNASTPIPYWCEEGQHWYKKTLNAMQSSKEGCGKCLKVDPEEVRERLKSTGKHIPLVWVYQNNYTPIPYWCEEGGHWAKKTWGSVQSGNEGCSKCLEVDPEEVRERFKSIGKHIPFVWVYQDNKTPIPYWCEEGQHWHDITWDSFSDKPKRCGRCAAEKHPFRHKAWSYPAVVGWVLSRLYLELGDSEKAFALAEEFQEALPEEHSVRIRDILSTRQGHEATDHIVPVSFFDYQQIDQVVSSNSATNIRNIHKVANNRRKDNLTLTEIVLLFRDPERRRIYNTATNYDKKREKGLPDNLPIDQEVFEEWCASVAISQEDRDRFYRWYNKQMLRLLI